MIVGRTLKANSAPVRATVPAVGDHKAQNSFEVLVRNLDDLNGVMRNLGRVRGVMKVPRVRG
mgnify:CR=1 FL=1